MLNTKIGTTVTCLVAMWGGVHEATAKRIIKASTGKPAWFVSVQQSRGKGGKEIYTVTGIVDDECESFVIV